MEKIKELVVISGKGGTGKTSIVSAFASLAENKVMADCDVDAADLFLILKPEIKRRENFYGGLIARIDRDKCILCRKCFEYCHFKAITFDIELEESFCEGCSVCARFCPVNAIDMLERLSGEVFISHTRLGPMVHAKLGVAEENSGKLVTKVRKEAKLTAEKEGLNLIIVDGSPGTGCPVISSLAGADEVLVVTEPTVSGIYDMERVISLCRNFNITPSLCINKYDINTEMSKKIENYCNEKNIELLGVLPYDDITTKAMLEGKTVMEYSDGEFSGNIKSIWCRIERKLELPGHSVLHKTY